MCKTRFWSRSLSIMSDFNKKCVDFNVNLAQVFDDSGIDKGLELIDYASSVNISCSISQANPMAIKTAVEHCKFKSKELGALISLPDSVENPSELSNDELEAIVLYQLGALSAFTKAYSLNIEHVRPSGLLYKTAAMSKDFSVSLANAVKKFSEWLLLYGAAGSVIKETEQEANINIAQEVLLNVPYKNDGTVDFDAEKSNNTGLELIRVRRLMNLSEIEAANGNFIKTDFDTIHFDSLADNTFELIKEARNIVEPRPVNYNKVVESGWVE